MAGSFWGKILCVDLSMGTVEQESLDPAIYRDYFGGYGLGVRLLYERMLPGADPLGPDNILGFVPGLLNGTGVPFSARFTVVAKSPLTGGWGDANCGGHFGPALRAAGFDGVFVRGISERAVYLFIDQKEGRIELRDASHLWGLDSVETDRQIREEVGRGVQIVCIGPAGEKLSLISGIVSDGGRLAARSGLGAVMGAKRLKAVVVQGAERLPIHDNEALSRSAKGYRQLFKKETPGWLQYVTRKLKIAFPLIRSLGFKPSGGPVQMVIHACREYGTCSGVALLTEIGDAPVQNWRGVAMRDFPLNQSALLSDDAITQHRVERYHCRHCPIGCGGFVRIEGGRHSVEKTHKPEFETLAAFGSLLLNDDLPSIIKINDICDRYGMDTISAGASVAFAIECMENGLISQEDAGGLDLSWGNSDAIVELVWKMVRREGFGNLLADGTKRAAEQIGKGSEAFAMHAGGQELSMHDSRYEPVVGLGYLLDPTPGRHTTSNLGLYGAEVLDDVFALENVGTMPKGSEAQGRGLVYALVNRYMQIVNCIGICLFTLTMGKPPVLEWINAATGWDIDLKELLHVGHRVQVLRYAFNLREGIRPKDVSLPARAKGDPPLDTGPLKEVSLDVDAMVREYFRAMGYDETTGVPTGELLESLGLAEIVRL